MDAVITKYVDFKAGSHHYSTNWDFGAASIACGTKFDGDFRNMNITYLSWDLLYNAFCRLSPTSVIFAIRHDSLSISALCPVSIPRNR